MKENKNICPICANETLKKNGIYREDKLCITHTMLYTAKPIRNKNNLITRYDFLPDIEFNKCILCNTESNGFALCKNCIMIKTTNEIYETLKNHIFFNERNTKLINKLHPLRNSRRLSKKELAKKLDISEEEYEQYENGTRELNLDIVLKLADLYQLSIDFLIGRPVDYNIVENKGNSLTDNETELINCFRYLDNDKQSQTIGYIQALNNI